VIILVLISTFNFDNLFPFLNIYFMGIIQRFTHERNHYL